LSRLCQDNWKSLMSTTADLARAQRTARERLELSRQDHRSRCVDALLKPAADADPALRDHCKAVLAEPRAAAH
jgi:hypothetical protein